MRGAETLQIRLFKHHVFKGLVWLLSIALLVPLALVLWHVVASGAKAIHPSFFVHVPAPVGEPGGGILNALIGSAGLVFLASVLAVPTGIFVGIYLAEYKNSALAYWVRVCVEVLQGTPSIVVGVVAYVWVVLPMGKFSAFAGSVALALMMLPVIIRTSEETLKLIPQTLKEASLGLGVPYYRTLLKVVVPSARVGIVSGILLSVARVAGETAPLLFTAFGSPFVSFNVFKPISSLPLIIFNYATSPYEDWHTMAWGAALVLVSVIFVLNVSTKFFVSRK
ncbi:MAG: phosphate ABC transporter permease PstA [Candidatus Margulisiibacteriota bacterium]